MGRIRKDAKPLNVNIERDIHERFERVCLEAGQSKTVAVERALLMYIDAMSRKSDDKGDTGSGQ